MTRSFVLLLALLAMPASLPAQTHHPADAVHLQAGARTFSGAMPHPLPALHRAAIVRSSFPPSGAPAGRGGSDQPRRGTELSSDGPLAR